MTDTATAKTLSASGLPRGYKEPLTMTTKTTTNDNGKMENDNGITSNSDPLTVSPYGSRPLPQGARERPRQKTISVSGLPRGYKEPLAMTTLPRQTTTTTAKWKKQRHY
jgi:hypothetical protein